MFLVLTIHRRMTDHGLEGLSKFSDITDAELDQSRQVVATNTDEFRKNIHQAQETKTVVHR